MLSCIIDAGGWLPAEACHVLLESPMSVIDDVRYLGEVLGKTILQHEGKDIFDKIEDIRNTSKALSRSETTENELNLSLIDELEDHEILPIARAFNQFLNLANIAEQDYSTFDQSGFSASLEQLLVELLQKHNGEDLFTTVEKLNVELVLTAHPTEATRRTLIKKYDAIASELSNLRRSDLYAYEQDASRARIKQLVEEVWCTNEIRDERPTPLDEARWGFAVVENSLWHAVPDFIRHLDSLCQKYFSKELPLDNRVFSLFSWMGGDRDGNPNVTHTVTKNTLLVGRRNAALLYIEEFKKLCDSLSMTNASEEVLEALEINSAMPYRSLLKQTIRKLDNTVSWCESNINQEKSIITSDEIVSSRADLLQPLYLCWESLNAAGLGQVARGPLLDTIRRVHCFGINLLPLDVRQDGERHTQVLSELTRYYELGDYAEWSEQKRQDYLLEQLEGKRPLFPAIWPVSDESLEVINTCKAISKEPPETLSHYIISMAKNVSDVLAVILILKECGMNWSMPIVPLFETLDDLKNAAGVMEKLWLSPWYKKYSGGIQTVMIGYSDSAKDAGRFAATWAQYEAQEKLVSLASNYGVELTLFHGRGGTVGRGGGPVDKAMASQPPGSVNGRIRVTEQGEMIRYKFGRKRTAVTHLSTYACATLRATLLPHEAPKKSWRKLMDGMAQQSLGGYRGIVREHPNFVPYFRSLTPEQELSKLALGSRPAKRKQGGGVETLRAIPWVFAWAQVRLNIPAWLGIYDGLKYALEKDEKSLQEMLKDWAFFSSFFDLIEMVLVKSDADVSAYYEKVLVDDAFKDVGMHLRNELVSLKKLVRQVRQQETLLASSPELLSALSVRKPYINPLNILQVELIKRERKAGKISPSLERALKVTMAGVAAGMRNTG